MTHNSVFQSRKCKQVKEYSARCFFLEKLKQTNGSGVFSSKLSFALFDSLWELHVSKRKEKKKAEKEGDRNKAEFLGN